MNNDDYLLKFRRGTAQKSAWTWRDDARNLKDALVGLGMWVLIIAVPILVISGIWLMAHVLGAFFTALVIVAFYVTYYLIASYRRIKALLEENANLRRAIESYDCEAAGIRLGLSDLWWETVDSDPDMAKKIRELLEKVRGSE